jgi:uncharacterized CHY-type Zn-finger protein
LIENDFISKLNSTVHERVQCDGCGAHPIIGSRYKCSVCKNFDYCPRCEELLQHPHPFIKITDPNTQVDSIVTGVVDEEEELESEDE